MFSSPHIVRLLLKIMKADGGSLLACLNSGIFICALELFQDMRYLAWAKATYNVKWARGLLTKGCRPYIQYGNAY
jgi:hypothetical protein